MITHTLKINISNIKKKVNTHYFKYRDIFYRILIVNICVYSKINNTLLQNTIIEDTGYNQYLLYLINKQLNLTGLLSELNITSELPLYIDLSLYIDEFLQTKHMNNYINIYSLSITDNGYLHINNKKIDKGNIYV